MIVIRTEAGEQWLIAGHVAVLKGLEAHRPSKYPMGHVKLQRRAQSLFKEKTYVTCLQLLDALATQDGDCPSNMYIP